MHFVVGVLIMGSLFLRRLLKKCNDKNHHNYQDFSQKSICHAANAKVERQSRFCCDQISEFQCDFSTECSALYEYDQFRVYSNANRKLYS